MMETVAPTEFLVNHCLMDKSDPTEFFFFSPSGAVLVRDRCPLVGRVVGIVETERRVGRRRIRDAHQPVEIVLGFRSREPGRARFA